MAQEYSTTILSPYQAFIESLKTEATRTNYIRGLNYFMQFCSIRPGDYNALLQNNDSKLIQLRIIDFIIHCKARKLSPASIDMYIASLKKFYIQNDILTVNWKKVNSYKPEFCNVIEDEAYTRDQLAYMISMADIRDKAILLLLASTGCRIGSVPKLRLKDIKPIEIPGIGIIYQVTIYKKAKQQYISYTTPEAYQAISAYVEYRRRCNEKLTEDSVLFRKRFNKTLPLEVENMVQPITVWSIYWTLEQLLDKTGIRPGAKMTESDRAPKRTALMMSHGIRKWTISSMISAKLEYTAREKLVGHKKSIGLDQNYDRRPESEILAEYCKAISYLTINEESRLKAKAEKLETENVAQKQVIAKTYEMYETMQKQINEIRNEQQRNGARAYSYLKNIVKKVT